MSEKKALNRDKQEKIKNTIKEKYLDQSERFVMPDATKWKSANLKSNI